MSNDQATQARTYNGKVYSAYDIYPEFDSAMAEVEANLAALDETLSSATYADILNDFGTRPEGMTDEQWDEMVHAISCGYSGEAYRPIHQPDPEFWRGIYQRYGRYLQAAVKSRTEQKGQSC